MNKVIIYHHRTRATGAEGVHIRGVISGFVAKGYFVEDISFVKSDCKKYCYEQKVNLKKTIYDFLSDRLPNKIFKILELLYPLRAYIVLTMAMARLKNKNLVPEFIYDRYAYFSFGMALFSDKNKIPLILEVNTTCLDHDIREIKFRRIAEKIEKYCFFNADLIVVVSHYLKQKIVDSYGINEEKILVTPNAVNPKHFVLNSVAGDKPVGLEDARSFARGRIIVGFVGVFVPWHGLDLLVDAFERLVNEIGESKDLGLILVGDGPARPLVEDLLVKKKISNKVIITGMVDHSEIKYLIDLFDIAVMPDSNPFGSPMKIFEYMVMGKTILAPDYSPIEEIIIDGNNGIVFHKKDTVDLLMNLKKLINNPSLCKALGAKAKIDALEHHTWEKNAAKILKKLVAMNET